MRGGLESDKGTSLRFTACEAFASFALTPSPSPTLWERGVGANGCSPAAVFSLARPAGEGDTGGEGKQASTPNAKQGRTVRAPLHDEPHPRVRGKRVRAYFFRRRRPSKPARPAPNTIIDAGSGTFVTIFNTRSPVYDEVEEAKTSLQVVLNPPAPMK